MKKASTDKCSTSSSQLEVMLPPGDGTGHIVVTIEGHHWQLGGGHQGSCYLSYHEQEGPHNQEQPTPNVNTAVAGNPFWTSARW